MRKSPSAAYFDYTCNNVDNIMARLQNMLMRDCSEESWRDIEQAIDWATAQIKKDVTYPGREAFDAVVVELDDLKDTCNSLEKEVESYRDEVDDLSRELERVGAAGSAGAVGGVGVGR